MLQTQFRKQISNMSKKRIELKPNVTNTVTIIFQCKSIDRLEGSRVSNTLHVMTGKARDNFKCMSVGRFTKIGTNNQIWRLDLGQYGFKPYENEITNTHTHSCQTSSIVHQSVGKMFVNRISSEWFFFEQNANLDDFLLFIHFCAANYCCQIELSQSFITNFWQIIH